MAANGSGARQNSTQSRSSAKTMWRNVASVMIAVEFAHQISAATPTTIRAASAQRNATFFGNASPGRQSTASAIRIGYSATQLNVCGATSATAMPPIMPPADIHR